MSILTKPLHLPKLPKPVGIVIKTVLIAIAVLALIWLALFIHAMTFTTDYVNATARRKDTVDSAYLAANSYEINLPFFGNSTLLGNKEEGMGYMIPFYLEGGLVEYAYWQIMGAYDNINFVLDDYTRMLSSKYEGRANVNYTVEKSDGLLTVRFDGAGYNADGSLAENISKEFVFDVKGASAFNFPKWINRTPEDDWFASNLELT